MDGSGLILPSSTQEGEEGLTCSGLHQQGRSRLPTNDRRPPRQASATLHQRGRDRQAGQPTSELRKGFPRASAQDLPEEGTSRRGQEAVVCLQSVDSSS